MNCDRCNALYDEPAVARVRSEILDLKVCGPCALVARELGLTIEALPQLSLSEPNKRVGAAA